MSETGRCGDKSPDEIEVTDEMIEAGFAALKLSGLADEYLKADKHTVVEIWLAMCRASQRLGYELEGPQKS